MRKVAIGLALLIASASVAEAQHHRHRHHNNHYHHHHHHKRNNNNWVAPLVGGLIVGGMLYGMSQPSYAAPPQSYYPHQPYYGPRYCERRVVGYNWNGYREVPIVHTFCN